MQAEANQVTLNGEGSLPRQRMHIGNMSYWKLWSSNSEGVNQNKLGED